MVIAFALLPAYLGAGAALVAWGAVVMFVNPLLREGPPADTVAAPWWHKGLWWLGGVAVLGLGLALIRVPVIAAIPVALDARGSYQVTAPIAGMVQDLPVNGSVAQGGVIAVLDNPAMQADAADLRMGVALATQLLQSLQGADPARALVASEQVAGLTDRLAVLEREIAAMRLVAPQNRVVVPTKVFLHQGWVEAGAPLASFYPMAGPSILTGAFPEHLIEIATELTLEAGLRLGRDSYVTLDPADVVLREVVSFDSETGSRTWQVFATYAGQPPAALAGATGLLRLRYQPVPLWRHAAMKWAQIAARFREAQITDQARYLE